MMEEMQEKQDDENSVSSSVSSSGDKLYVIWRYLLFDVVLIM